VTERTAPWPLAAATGPWCVPGTDAGEAQRTVLGEFPEFPTLVELPDRGVGADAVGRTAARLASISSDLAVETNPNGWRLAAAPGRDVRRATSFLTADLDDLEELTQGWAGPLVIGLVGPWTLAARIELVNGERLIADRGATRDIGVAFVELAHDYVVEVLRRVPGATLILRLDEPDLADAIAGRLATQSGWGRLRSVPEQQATNVLGAIVEDLRPQGAQVAIRALGMSPTFVRGTGAGSLWHDLARPTDPDEFGEWFDGGGATIFEIDLPGGPDRIGAQVRQLGRLAGQVGLDLERLMSAAALAPQVAQLRSRGLVAVGKRLNEVTMAIRTEVAGRE
jgi:hypothetical protein